MRASLCGYGNLDQVMLLPLRRWMTRWKRQKRATRRRKRRKSGRRIRFLIRGSVPIRVEDEEDEKEEEEAGEMVQGHFSHMKIQIYGDLDDQKAKACQAQTLGKYSSFPEAEFICCCCWPSLLNPRTSEQPTQRRGGGCCCCCSPCANFGECESNFGDREVEELRK